MDTSGKYLQKQLPSTLDILAMEYLDEVIEELSTCGKTVRNGLNKKREYKGFIFEERVFAMVDICTNYITFYIGVMRVSLKFDLTFLFLFGNFGI